MNIKIKARAIILKENKVFLVNDTRVGKFFLPGGTREKGESILETLDREIVEELGIKPIIDKNGYFREYETYDKSKGIEFTFFLKNVDDFYEIDRSKCSHADEWDICGFYDIDELDKIEVYPDNLGKLIKLNISNSNFYFV